ncbi:MAG: hypothetical protein U0736_06690 [Gemmataceae bacterium]
MKLVEGTSFTTVMRYPGVLPVLPAGGVDRARLARLLRQEADSPPRPITDTYGDGKWLGRTATLIPIAEQVGQAETADVLRKQPARNWKSG